MSFDKSVVGDTGHVTVATSKTVSFHALGHGLWVNMGYLIYDPLFNLLDRNEGS